jgi:hypothetical protein
MMRSCFLAGAALLFWSIPAQGQVSWKVVVNQLSRPLLSPAPAPQPVSSSSREGSGAGALTANAGASAAAPPEVVQACREVGLRGTGVAGVDCGAILQAADARASQPSSEGVLLGLTGQRTNNAAPDTSRSAATVDADAVARQLSTGNAQGNSAGEIVRSREAPPANRPR